MEGRWKKPETRPFPPHCPSMDAGSSDAIEHKVHPRAVAVGEITTPGGVSEFPCPASREIPSHSVVSIFFKSIWSMNEAQRGAVICPESHSTLRKVPNYSLDLSTLAD